VKKRGKEKESEKKKRQGKIGKKSRFKKGMTMNFSEIFLDNKNNNGVKMVFIKKINTKIIIPTTFNIFSQQVVSSSKVL
jgi:hypothetical protein